MSGSTLLEVAQTLEACAAKLRALAGGTNSTTRAAASRPTSGDVPRVPFGRQKGEPLEVVDVTDLRWLASALERSIDDASKAQYRQKNERDLEAVRAELAARASGAPRSPGETAPAPEGGGDDDIPF